MIIGIDFDNTIVCYDQLFQHLALERNLIPQDHPINKQQIRDFLHRRNQQLQWTELQGIAYGHRIMDAPPFPGVLDFFSQCCQQGIETVVISHRSRTPIRGDSIDMHEAARGWIKANGLFSSERQTAYFETTREKKIERIAQLGCDIFIDDLSELLSDENFPISVRGLLFDPHDCSSDHARYNRAHSWPEISHQIIPGKGPC